MGRRKLPTFSNHTMIQLSATPKPPANSRKRGRRDANIDPLSEEGDVPEASTPQKPMVRLPKGKDPQESIAPVDRVATRSDTGKAKSSAVSRTILETPQDPLGSGDQVAPIQEGNFFQTRTGLILDLNPETESGLNLAAWRVDEDSAVNPQFVPSVQGKVGDQSFLALLIC
jgi:hypothetical protein